jgi:LAO/AO transport system kinase
VTLRDGARPEQVAARLLQGDRRALARAITCLEDGGEAARELLALVYPHGGHAHVVGVTGATGTGKSTLVNALACRYRQRGLTVGILAVDPTSPFTGGALLGDRLRMRDLAGDEGVFIRSMATRGASGGVSRVAADAAQALDAAGYDRIFIETVGAGQDEVEIGRLAHTVIVVEAPGLGDEIQAIKAGILETANVLVVNKADREGAEQTMAALRMMLELADSNPSSVTHHGTVMAVAAPSQAPRPGSWQPPLLSTVATEGRGADAVLDAIESHREYLAESGQRAAVEMRRAEAQLNSALEAALRRLLSERAGPAAYRQALERVLGRSSDPHTAAKWLTEQLCGRPEG